jgi:hypothetical protein
MRAGSLAPLAAFAFVGLLHCSSASRTAFETEEPGAAKSDGGNASDDTPTGFGDASALPGTGNNTACSEDIDIVLVLDVSSTMDFVLKKLGSEMQKVVDASNALKSGAHFGLVVYADNSLLDSSGDDAGGKVHTTAATLKKAFADVLRTYTDANRNPGDGPSGRDTQNPICEENTLDALHMAATDFPWRQKAAHVVIVATDDTFIEAPDNYGDRDGDGQTDKTDFPTEGDYPAKFTLDETIATLKGGDIRVFSFTRLKAPFFGNSCSTPRRHMTSSGRKDEESIAYGWSKPYHGKAPVPDQTGGKNFDLDGVKSGKLSLAATINEVVLESHCAGGVK